MALGQSIGDDMRRFMADTFFIDFDHDVTPDTDLFAGGFIDSYGFVQLIDFIEQNYGVRIEDDDFESPLISSFRGLLTLVSERLDGVAP